MQNFLVWKFFVVRHSFRIVSGDSPETLRELLLSAKFRHQQIRFNYGILGSVVLLVFQISNGDLFNPFIHNIEKWPNILQTFFGVMSIFQHEID